MKVKDKLCRELPTAMTDVKKAQLQSDLHTAQKKVDELQKEVSFVHFGTQPVVYLPVYQVFFCDISHVCLAS